MANGRNGILTGIIHNVQEARIHLHFTDTSVTIETQTKPKTLARQQRGDRWGGASKEGWRMEGKEQENNIHAAMADNMCSAHNFNINTKTSQASHSF